MRHFLWALLCLGGCTSAQHSSIRPDSLLLTAASPALDLSEGQVRILADKARTGGGWAALERTEPPGTRTALHRHNRMDEAFYVVSGSFSCFIDGKLHQLSPGAFVFIPRGTPHAQGNASPGEVKIIAFFSPAGWEQSARDRAALHAEHPVGTEEFSKRIGRVFAEHDIEILGASPIPRR